MVNDHTSGTWGTSKWTLDTTNNVLHIGAGTVTDTGVKVDATTNEVTDWGALDWHNYKAPEGTERPLLRLDGPVIMDADASYAFSYLTLDNDSKVGIDIDKAGDTSNLVTDKTTNMTGMFAHSIKHHDRRLYLPLNTSKVTTMAHMFDNFWGAYDWFELMGFDTSHVTDMSYMFYDAEDITELMLPGFDTSKVTTMAHMFDRCHRVETLDLSGFDTSNVTSMASMFYYNTLGHQSIDLSNFNTAKVTDMSNMFGGDLCLNALDISSFDTSNVTNMAGMFYGVNGEAHGDVTIKWPKKMDTNKVTNMSAMFAKSDGVVDDHINELDKTNVTDMSSMFEGIDSYADQPKDVTLDFSNFKTSHVTNMSRMFADIKQLKSLKFSSLFDTATVTNMAGMFAGDAQLPNLDLTNFDTSRVVDMSQMFMDMAALTNLNLATFKTGQVADMSSMFKGVSQLSAPNLQNFDTSRVVNMSQMFMDMAALTNLNWSDGFKTGQATDMSSMFKGVSQLSALDLQNFDTSHVVNMSQMFMDMAALTNLNLTTFKTGQVTDMGSMFKGASQITELDLHSFDTSRVSNMSQMFVNDGALQKLDLSSFNLQNIQLPYSFLENSDDTGMWRIFGLFNAPKYLSDRYNLVETKPRVLILGKDMRLSVDHPANLASDIIDLGDQQDLDGPLEPMIGQLGFNSIQELKDAFFSANLPAAGGLTGRWVNMETGERLTAQELTARYSSDQATTGTWIWQNIVGQDVDLIASPVTTWSPEDSFVKAVDDNGNTLELGQLTITLRNTDTNTIVDKIDPRVAGNYEITYSYTGNGLSSQTSGPVKLRIAANQAAVDAHDSVVQLGENWQATDNLQGVVDADGSVVDFNKVTVSGMADNQIPGTYAITYQFTDQFGTLVTKTVHVVVNGLTLKQNAGRFSTDDHWDPRTLVDRAVDDLGNPVSRVAVLMTDAKGQTVTNLDRPGDYQIKYRFNDGHGTHEQAALITITAGENHANLQLKTNQVTLYEGDSWEPLSNVQSVVDSDNQQINVTDWAQAIQVDGMVNTEKPGDYSITYQFVDLFGTTHEDTVVVTVKASQASLAAKKDAVTIYAGDTWQASDNLESVKDVDGSSVDSSQVTISSNVDLTRPGHYLVTYRFTDQQNKLHTATTAVTVLANQANLTVKDAVVHLTVGDQWNALANLQPVTDSDGTTVQPSAIQVDSSANLNMPGSYVVTYQFTDQLGKVHTAQTQVIVEAKTDPDDGGNGTVEVPDENGDNGDKEPGNLPDGNQNQGDKDPGNLPDGDLNQGDNKPGNLPDDNSGQTTTKQPDEETTEKQDPEVPENMATETTQQTTVKKDVEALPKNVAAKPTEKLSVATDHLKSLQPIKPTLKTKATGALPQTGEQMNKRVSIIGLIVLALSSLGLPWLFKEKKNHQDN
ncbi:BspA family leucine-rich repeat surface protein [Lactiplantibacillus paraxiangfangensis]|uniref:BspA family leucine-rich repeat surface protein n=1 Tax=Lactiplantibacillus paraxiangfangensis TaxID=3076224 RepID=UPI0030C6A754